MTRVDTPSLVYVCFHCTGFDVKKDCVGTIRNYCKMITVYCNHENKSHEE